MGIPSSLSSMEEGIILCKSFPAFSFNWILMRGREVVDSPRGSKRVAVGWSEE